MDENLVNILKNEYNLILLTRNPFDCAISFKIAQIIKRYHNFGQDPIKIDKKVYLDKKEVLDLIYFIYNCNKVYKNIANQVFTYDYIINNWNLFVRDFSKIINFKNEVKQTILKNPEKPEDLIENYQELKECYNEFYSGLV